jgi:SOS-response transcriptional repressor LexA
MSWNDRLQSELEAKGWTKAELARRSGVPYDSVNKYLRGSIDQPRGDTIDKLADALEVDRLWLKEGVRSAAPAPKAIHVPPGRLPYAGRVAAGDWLDNDDFNQDLADNSVPESVPRHPRYPQLEQMAWRVFGDSMNEAGILEGMWLVGASYADYVDKIGELDNGNYVVVERTRYQGSERELTVKEVQFARKGMRLIPRSTNEKHKEYFIPLDTDADPDRESVRILGVVLWVGRDLAPGAK